MGRWGLGGGGVGGKEYPDDRGPELFGEVVGHQGEDVAVLCESVRLVDSYKGRVYVSSVYSPLRLAERGFYHSWPSLLANTPSSPLLTRFLVGALGLVLKCY
ncbi:uncharacterized protein SCHCODRAFT_02241279 [Schizophyllum commune H4-8]|uniref:uncharacterized protein n=1 Tax=Schizophyllum commune (strain H4-8 / FGSC 9210) TaxID=578458 RepID=UPI00215E30F9|nr:uncharacterized protein SCHCODRAFT_02241279 [Schizophyllum commune H4-8]KAI5895860.1 hypothetical protein SCHCODRAFT_02241279 [Schizophyllum commune H4-8]